MHVGFSSYIICLLKLLSLAKVQKNQIIGVHMSFFSKLFGGGKSAASQEPKILGEEDYQGYIITGIEMKQGSEFILAGTISKQFDDELKVKKFIRADRLHSADQANQATIKKGKQIIDQSGDGLFDNLH